MLLQSGASQGVKAHEREQGSGNEKKDEVQHGMPSLRPNNHAPELHQRSIRTFAREYKEFIKARSRRRGIRGPIRQPRAYTNGQAAFVALTQSGDAKKDFIPVSGKVAAAHYHNVACGGSRRNAFPLGRWVQTAKNLRLGVSARRHQNLLVHEAGTIPLLKPNIFRGACHLTCLPIVLAPDAS